MKFSQIKILSKGILNGNIINFFIFILVGVFIVALFSILTYCLGALVTNPIVAVAGVVSVSTVYFLFISALRSGSTAWFRFYNSQTRAKRCIFWFNPKRTLKSTALYFSLFVRKLMWTVFLLLPGSVTVTSFVLLALDGGIEFNLFLCGICGGAIMLLAGLAVRFIVIQKYFLASLILIENPKIKANSAIKESVSKMNGKLKKTAAFKLSFTPWFSICVGILPIIYVLPYYKQGCLMYAKSLV